MLPVLYSISRARRPEPARDFGRILLSNQSQNGSMPVHTGRLLLTPRDPFFAPDPDALCARLAAAGLLGDPVPGALGTFLVGRRFLELVLFTGCSVRIELTPPVEGDGAFCHVRILGPYTTPSLMSGRNTRPPRCRACRASLRDWSRKRASSASADIRCPACGEVAPFWTWDWKEQAGWGRLFVQIEEVFPGEAMPAPDLMNLLRELTAGEPWRQFYVQDP